MKTGILTLIMLTTVLSIQAQDIVVQGKVEFDFKKYGNIRAGEDYKSYLTSKKDAVNIDIKRLKKNQYWYVAVSKRDINWDNNVKVFVCRSSNGNGQGYVWGGTNFQRVHNLPCYFFSGYRKLNNIDLQYQLRGLSASLESGTYHTDIVFTLYED